MIRRRALGAVALLLVGGVAGAASPRDRRAKQVEEDFRRIEKRLDGTDAALRDACGRAASLSFEDRPVQKDHAVVERVSEVAVTGVDATSMRPCVRAIADAGIVEGWVVKPATVGSAATAGWTITTRLRRAQRDPENDRLRTDAQIRDAAARLTAIWKTRTPAAEALSVETIAPDLVHLTEARWNAGNVTLEGTADDERFVETYRGLLAAEAPGVHFEWKLDVVRPPDAARFAFEPPRVPNEGLLRAGFRHAPPGALLRAFAVLDRRDFVVPTLPAVDGSLAGGWNGIVRKLAEDAGRASLHVGAVNVYAPAGTKQPDEIFRTGKRVTLDLEAVAPAKVTELLGVAGTVKIEAPAGLAPLDVHVVRVPWDQALDAVALASGCTVEQPAPDRRALRCPHASASANATPSSEIEAAAASSAPDDRPPLLRTPISDLRVAVLATREGGHRWTAQLETPDGLHVTTGTGSLIGLDLARAVVDEHGVAVVFERPGAAGTITAATRLPF